MIVDVVPGVIPVATPPAVTVAPVEALQLTFDVRFCMLPSEYVPIAVNCCMPLGATVAVAGVTAIDFNCGVGCVVGVDPPPDGGAPPPQPVSTATRPPNSNEKSNRFIATEPQVSKRPDFAVVGFAVV